MLQPLEIAGLLFATLAFGVAAVAARRRRADIGWWTWAWALLIVAGLGLQLGDDRSLPRAAGAFLAVLFPAIQLAGAFEYTERPVPRWLMPSFAVLASIRLAIAVAGFEAWSHMAVVPFELAALVAGAALVLRSRWSSGPSPMEWMIGVGFLVIAGAELIDSVLDTRGAGVSWAVWLAIGVPVGSCQVLATFDRMQHQLSASLAERERALRAIEASNERFRAIAEQADDVILEANPARGILYVNPRFSEVLGYPPEQVLGRRLGDFAWDPDDFPTRSDLEGQRRRRFGAVKVRHLDDSPRWMETSTSYYESDGEQHLIVVARDVTERLRSEEERRKGQKLESLGLMAGGIAHDFNNLLLGILGNADLAQSDLAAGHPARQLLKQVIEAAWQAAKLTQQLQAYAGASPFELRRVDLTEEIRAQADLVRTAVAERATLEFALEADLPAVEADPSLLLQAVMNLAVNGAEACDEGGGTVGVRTGRTQIRDSDPAPATGSVSPGEYVYVEVEDDGHGIPESLRDRIFDPFFTTNATGRGLGLAVVHGVVKTLRGALFVDSTPHHGSRFRLLLPISSPAAAPSLARKPAKVEGTETLLVIDDDASVLETMRAALQRCGYDVLTASSGERAMQLATSREIDLVLLDAVLPGESGEQIFEQLRALNPHIPVLLVSGYAKAEAMQRFAHGGSLSGFLAKPFTREVLAERVRQLLDLAAGAE
jgi:PAS domain S-box-containing protein